MGNQSTVPEIMNTNLKKSKSHSRNRVINQNNESINLQEIQKKLNITAEQFMQLDPEIQKQIYLQYINQIGYSKSKSKPKPISHSSSSSSSSTNSNRSHSHQSSDKHISQSPIPTYNPKNIHNHSPTENSTPPIPPPPPPSFTDSSFSSSNSAQHTGADNKLSFDKYQFFGLTSQSSLEDLKMAYRKIVMKYHPDRGGDPQIFAMIQTNYHEIEDEIKKNNMRIYNRPVVPQTYDDTLHQGQQSIHIDRDKFSIDRFNEIFNQSQSQLLHDIHDPTQMGYGNFMDKSQRRSSEDPVQTSSAEYRDFNDQEEEQTNEIKDLMIRREPEILYSGQGLSFVELGQGQITDFGGFDARGNNRYMDYKKAMMKSKEIQAEQRQEYRNLDEYKRARDNITPLTEEEKQLLEYQNQRKDQQEEERQRRMRENDHIIDRHFQNVNHFFIKR
jgi:curved DNA-binding protein CbpA